MMAFAVACWSAVVAVVAVVVGSWPWLPAIGRSDWACGVKATPKLLLLLKLVTTSRSTTAGLSALSLLAQSWPVPSDAALAASVLPAMSSVAIGSTVALVTWYLCIVQQHCDQ